MKLFVSLQSPLFYIYFFSVSFLSYAVSPSLLNWETPIFPVVIPHQF